MDIEVALILNRLEKEVACMYRQKSLNCDSCKLFCQSNSIEKKEPLSYFNIGNLFENDYYKVVFVGKAQWYDNDQIEALDFLDETVFRDCREDCKEMFKAKRWSRIWVCIRSIVQQLYPELSDNYDELLDRIAITNLRKCSASTGYEDKTHKFLTENCKNILEEEIKILKPKHIIFFTARKYDPEINSLKFGYTLPPIEISGDEKRIGNSKLCWKAKEFSGSDIKMRFLRTWHPDRAPLGFEEAIADWIKKA